jgi:hypothetical protein
VTTMQTYWRGAARSAISKKNALETPFIEKLTGGGYLDSMSRHSSSHLMIPDLWRLSKLCNCVRLMMC